MQFRDWDCAARRVPTENSAVRTNTGLTTPHYIRPILYYATTLFGKLLTLYFFIIFRVQCRRRIGVKENQWRRWSLQIQSLLTNRDGTILDGIYLWKKNIDREFKGVEECSICYSVLHVVDHSLPKVNCSVCHNSFHSGCLYKWFSNANKSTCPLCRSEF